MLDVLVSWPETYELVDSGSVWLPLKEVLGILLVTISFLKEIIAKDPLFHK